ncbi:MAG: hypothetical protein M1818_001306 [Claussenomyces sp. TS43310]|nr:MAG: hypothetical protein M1818_001306 [Claussenomyces sp. TS43310]
MSLLNAAVYPGKSLGFFVLGASLHDVLTRIKAEPQSFPKLDLIYSATQPVLEPVVVHLPSNGIRLRFDGPAQRLRLIEVVDFSKSRLTYSNTDVAKPATSSDTTPSAPSFRHIYRHLLGPTFPGEYLPPDDDVQDHGLYVLSYPGVAFTFPVKKSSWPHDKDHVDLLSSSATLPAASMAIFLGESWTVARQVLYTQEMPQPLSLILPSKTRESIPEEIDRVKILGEGRLEMIRPWASTSFRLALGRTTPQDLVAELGPPDAIYRKNDQRMLIHNTRTGSEPRARSIDSRLQDDSTDTDQSSTYTTTDVSGDESEVDVLSEDTSGECFYNYFYQGFDILISTKTEPSRRPPSLPANMTEPSGITSTSAPFVATKIILHSNVPGSYPFNRHRRCRWEIDYLFSETNDVVNSESAFEEISGRLYDEWRSIYANEEEARQRQRGMVLNRGWGDSPGSSCELLGGWEESAGGKRREDSNVAPDVEQSLGNTTLYGFPGLVFEVLKNGTVSGLTVF